MCIPVVLIGHLGRRGACLAGVLNEVPPAVGHGFGPPAVQCESQAPPGMLEEDGLACPVVDVEELVMHIGELRGNQVNGAVVCAGQLPVRAGDEDHDLPRVVGVEPGLDWPRRAWLGVELLIEGPSRSVVGGADFFLWFLEGLREGGRCLLGVLHPGYKFLHVGTRAGSPRIKLIS